MNDKVKEINEARVKKLYGESGLVFYKRVKTAIYKSLTSQKCQKSDREKIISTIVDAIDKEVDSMEEEGLL